MDRFHPQNSDVTATYDRFSGEDPYDLHADWLNDNRIPAGLEEELENFGVRDTYGALMAFRDQEIRRMRHV